MEKKWDWLVKFLLSDADADPNDLEVYVLGEAKVQEKLIQWMHSLHPKHKDPMVAYYWNDAERDDMTAQGIYHGRMALWAALRWPQSIRLEELKELVSVGN